MKDQWWATTTNAAAAAVLRRPPQCSTVSAPATFSIAGSVTDHQFRLAKKTFNSKLEFPTRQRRKTRIQPLGNRLARYPTQQNPTLCGDVNQRQRNSRARSERIASIIGRARATVSVCARDSSIIDNDHTYTFAVRDE